MCYKNFSILIYSYSYKSFFMNKINFFGNRKGLYSYVTSLDMLFFVKQIFIFKKMRKNIPRTIFILVLAKKKVFSKNLTFFSLFQTKKPNITIS